MTTPPDDRDLADEVADPADLVRRALAAMDTPTPRTTAELAALLDVDEDDLDDALMSDDADVLYFHPDRWANPAVLLDGVVEAHALTAEDLAAGRVRWTPDLHVVQHLENPTLVGGGTLDTTFDDHKDMWWDLPAGTLDGAAPGDLLLLHHEAGRVRLEVAPPADLGDVDLDALTAPILEVARKRREDQLGLEVAELALELAVVAPDVLRHPIPFGDLLVRAGLGVQGDYVLLPGEDPAEWQLERQRDFIDPEGAYDLMTVDAVARIASLRTSVRQEAVDLDPAEARGLDAGLTDPDATDLAATYLLGILGDTDGSIARTLDTIEAALPHPPGAGLYVLRARLAEFERDTAAQVAAIGAALGRDPDFPPALEDHAWNLEDRGDATAALAALRRADVRPDDPQYARLVDVTRPLYPEAGRNDPCPCGSGVKYKRCHLNRTDRDLAERVDWLLAKAMAFVHRPAQRLRVLEFLEVFGTSVPDGQAVALGDPIVAGMLLFDLGLMGDYVDVRGGLLPEDELELAEDWADTRFDVVEAAPLPTGGVVVNSLVDGRIHRLTTPQDVELLGDVDEDTVVATHVIATPAGDRVAFAALHVPEPFVEDAVEAAGSGDLLELSAWYEGQLFLRHLAEEQRRGR